MRLTNKIVSPEGAARIARYFRRLQAAGEEDRDLVLTNGCFDLLHVGHVSFLQDAARIGVLFVALNEDESVARLKGPGRPVVCLADRMKMVAAIECVALVTWFSGDAPHELVAAIRPDVLVKGGTTDRVVASEVVESYGARHVIVPTDVRESTTAIISRASSTHERASSHPRP